MLRSRSAELKRHPKLILALPIVAVVMALAVYVYYFTDAKDMVKNIGYMVPTEVAEVAGELPLTNKGKIILAASRPELNDRKEFNENCKSHDAEISVLGCYTDETIYLYDIKTNELPGIVQSTMAHELLHAAWDRLNTFEKTALQEQLMKVYEENREALASDLSLYAEEDRIDELHSRIGTEIMNLPESLERHYAKYFSDQDAVVAFYNQYSEPFKKLSAEIDALSEEIERKREEIDKQTEEYYKRVDVLNAEIDEFNSCAETPDCFDQATFYARRDILSAKLDELTAVYNDLNEQVLEFNKIVEEYNNNVFRTKALEDKINSNALPEVELEKGE